ncbi:MAG: 50S ribosomal protein L29 [Epsilonproteobacteria bacterium]|nr:50S ribosomal protein L29 [Campylobacterota bacterium]|tara:strand:+ start:182 stop:391 length:210 start_codon:yes stop_codon:yes gene_type:complete
MKKNIKEELKNMAQQDLLNRANEIRKELFLVRMKKVSNPEKNTALEKGLRKKLACALTFLRQRELHGEP